MFYVFWFDRHRFEEDAIKPKSLEGHTDTVWALAIGLDGRIYSGSADGTAHTHTHTRV
jgi:hypothetical protein